MNLSSFQIDALRIIAQRERGERTPQFLAKQDRTLKSLKARGLLAGGAERDGSWSPLRLTDAGRAALAEAEAAK